MFLEYPQLVSILFTYCTLNPCDTFIYIFKLLDLWNSFDCICIQLLIIPFAMRLPHWPYEWRRYLVSNDTISTVSKSNKYETCRYKLTTPLTNERHVLVGSYFYTHVSHLLDFNINNVVLFDKKYFFLCMGQCTCHNVDNVIFFFLKEKLVFQ